MEGDILEGQILQPQTLEETQPLEVGQTLEEKPKKLTPAEKKALKKKLALELKLQTKRQAEERERQIIRDHLAREQKYSEQNRKKLEEGWRNILISIKTPIMKKIILYTLNTIERMFEAKDFKISLMMDELDQADRQAELNNKSHLETIEKLIVTFREQLDHIKVKYKEDLQKIRNDKSNSINILTKRSEYNDSFLKMVLYGLDVENKNNIKGGRSEYMSKIGVQTTWAAENLIICKKDTTSIFEDLWKEYNEIFKDFFSETTKKRRGYDRIYEYVEKSADLIEMQNKDIIQNYESIHRLKKEYEHKKNDLALIESDLKEQSKYFYNTYKSLNSTLRYNTKTDYEKLVELVQICEVTRTHLNRIKSKGEKMLRFMAICGKFETQKEKIMPFPTSMEYLIRRKVDYASEFSYVRKMTNFWQKFAQADTTRHILHEEQIVLKKENDYLRKQMKKYCEESSCRCMFPSVNKIQKPKAGKIKK